MFMYPFGQYWYKCLPFGAAPVHNMFYCKIDEVSGDMPNVFGIAEDIMVIGYNKNGADHNAAVHKMMWRSQIKIKQRKVPL